MKRQMAGRDHSDDDNSIGISIRRIILWKNTYLLIFYSQDDATGFSFHCFI